MMRGLSSAYTRLFLLSLIFFTLVPSVSATTKGLNQIVTPDVQPEGLLSVSYQQVDPNIANRYQVQLELGLTKRFEVAIFQGFSRPEQVINAEYGIIQRKDVLLSAGFANYSTLGTAPQPYLEAGYQKGATYLMAGAIHIVAEQMGVGGSVRNQHQMQSILGVAYRVHPRLLLQLDYQSGSGNFATAGFTYNILPQLQFNPSAYFANTTGHHLYGYAVLTWNIDVFSPHHTAEY
jgi:hypothetical protein